MKIQKITIYDIAQRAGASASTVSSALDGSWKKRRISKKTAERIQEIAVQMDFTINRQAQGLRKAKSGLVGMILPEHNNRFFSDLSQSFAGEVRQRGNCPAIISTRRNEEEELEVVSNFISYAIDALFIVGATNPIALSKLCKSAELPHVFVDQPCELAPSIVTDNYFGAAELTNHLISFSPKSNQELSNQVYFLGGDATLPASSRRIDGFVDTLNNAGIGFTQSHINACGYDRDRAGKELNKLYAQRGGLPSILLINSIDCFEGALKFFSQLPEEEVTKCTIGCFDYDPFGILLRFPVHMIRQRANKLVKEAYDCIENNSGEPILKLIKPELIIP
ncbi:MAG: LacI family DNA-binding transcriptional regulator [Rhizobiales bacterium]|nr:LacI family DNA-binding transcriptional regulator [Hyphomicrobiales bacterium]